MKQFVGLDVSMKETAVCVVYGDGQRVWGYRPPALESMIPIDRRPTMHYNN